MTTINRGECCGVGELSQIDQTPESILKDICDSWLIEEDFNGAFLIFSDVRDFTHGEALKKFIADNKLGQVKVSLAKVNPNSGNPLKVYMWSVNKKAFEKYCHKNGLLICSNPYCDCISCPQNK